MTLKNSQTIEKTKWGTKVEYQRWLRINLSIAAYAYEIKGDSIIDDAKFDSLSLEVDTSIETGNKKMDTFFKKEFDPSTGQWIHKHPELNVIASMYETHYGDKND